MERQPVVARHLAAVLEELIKREPIFHRPEFGTTRSAFEAMTDSGFWEVGASGRRYSREHVVDTLVERHSKPHVDVWSASEFQCEELASDVYLLTYCLVQDRVRVTRRATIWRHVAGEWKIVYHQGTIVASESEHQAMRKLVSSGSPFEPRIGFSRAVRVGNVLAVAGTAPIAPDGGIACPGDVHGQTQRCLEIIAKAIADAGLSLETVVRTRIMLTDMSTWEAAARAHGEFFAAIRPANTFVEVKGFINREWLVEVEADCVAED
jgi:enamine deaminase RidA (YjgF/YER057c/UK114 family)